MEVSKRGVATVGPRVAGKAGIIGEGRPLSGLRKAQSSVTPQQRSQCLLMRGYRNPPFHRKPAQELLYLRRAHVARMAQCVEPHERTYPVNILLFGSQAVMLITNAFPHLVEQSHCRKRGSRRPAPRRAGFGGWFMTVQKYSLPRNLNGIKYFDLRGSTGYTAEILTTPQICGLKTRKPFLERPTCPKLHHCSRA